MPEGSPGSLPGDLRAGATEELVDATPDALTSAPAELAGTDGPQQAPRRKRQWRGIVGVIVLLAAAAAFFAAGFLGLGGLGNQGASTLTVAKVTRGDLVSNVQASGTVQPLSSTAVTSEYDGTIEDVRVAEGDVVSAGDVLFTVKNDQIEAAVSNAQQQADDAQAALDQAQQSYDSTMASFRAAVEAWNSAPDGETQQTLTDPRTLEDGVRAARQALADAQAASDAASQALAAAQAQQAKCTVTAPVGGTVLTLNAREGLTVGQAIGAVKTTANPIDGAGCAGARQLEPRPPVLRQADSTASSAALVVIGDVSQLRVTAQVEGPNAADVTEGQTATVTFPDVPDLTLDATVEAVTPAAADAGSGPGSGHNAIGGSDTASYQVELLISSPDDRVTPGMDANVTVETQRVSDVLLVPMGALQGYDEAAGTATVTVLTVDDKDQVTESEQRDVTVSATNGTDAAVEGVAEGELVEVRGTSADVASGDDTTRWLARGAATCSHLVSC